MFRTIRLEISGIPAGKGRPRFTRRGHAYTPEQTSEYEGRVAAAFYNSREKAFQKGTPIIVDVIAKMPIPKSTSKKKRLEMLEREKMLKKPDIDNIVKAVLDGLSGLAFPDDNQVWKIYAYKIYAEEPSTTVLISGDE